MGFEARLVVLTVENANAESIADNGETKAILWSDKPGIVIDFGHITRLEKVVSPGYAHIKHSSFRRASICVFDCLYERLWDLLDANIEKYMVPEILTRERLELAYRGESENQTAIASKLLVATAGQEYATGHCFWYSDHQIQKGKERRLIDLHNIFVSQTLSERRKAYEVGVNFFEQPFLWAPCSDLVEWWREADAKKTEGMQALSKDPYAVAVAGGWRNQLETLSSLGAKALFLVG